MRFPKTLTLLLLAVGLAFALPAWAQQKPFTQEQVSNMVRDGFADESGAKLIEQRGIDFAPAEDFLQNLKAAGANEAFLKALRTAKHAEPASAKKPINQVQVFALLAVGVPSHRVTMLVQGALEEYRAAYMLDRKDLKYKQNYDRLLEQVNK